MTRTRLMLLPLALLIATCASDSNLPMDSRNPCNSGGGPNYDRKAPIVCIDDHDLNNITVSPDGPNAHVYRSGFFHTTHLRWYTISGRNTVAIAWKETPVPTASIACGSGDGACDGKVARDAKGGEHHYWVTVYTANGQATTKDPTIIIDTN